MDTQEQEWRCSEGHQMLVKLGAKLDACPYYRLGEPCVGTVEQVVPPTHCDGSHHPATPIRAGSKRCECPVCGRRLTITPKTRKVPAHEARVSVS